MLAHSVGAVIATGWVHDYAPPIRALILATPALRVKLYVPLAIPGLRLLECAETRPKDLHQELRESQDAHARCQNRQRDYQADPLIARVRSPSTSFGAIRCGDAA